MPKTTFLPITTVFAFSLLVSACTSTTPTATPTTQPTEVPEETIMQESQPSEDITTEVRTTTSYESPAGEEEVSFILMVDNEGIITEAQTEVLGKAPISITRQESFAAELPTAVVGKKLADLTNVDRVGGSSLTTGAFNAVLPELQNQL